MPAMGRTRVTNSYDHAGRSAPLPPPSPRPRLARPRSRTARDADAGMRAGRSPMGGHVPMGRGAPGVRSVDRPLDPSPSRRVCRSPRLVRPRYIDGAVLAIGRARTARAGVGRGTPRMDAGRPRGTGFPRGERAATEETGMRRTRMARAWLGAVALGWMLTWSTPAWPAGIWFYEMATPDQGTAAAGRAALAVDASTAWGNPAGMTRLDQSQLLIGAGAFVLQSEFNVSPGTTNTGGGSNLTM